MESGRSKLEAAWSHTLGPGKGNKKGTGEDKQRIKLQLW